MQQLIKLACKMASNETAASFNRQDTAEASAAMGSIPCSAGDDLCTLQVTSESGLCSQSRFLLIASFHLVQKLEDGVELEQESTETAKKIS